MIQFVACLVIVILAIGLYHPVLTSEIIAVLVTGFSAVVLLKSFFGNISHGAPATSWLSPFWYQQVIVKALHAVFGEAFLRLLQPNGFSDAELDDLSIFSNSNQKEQRGLVLGLSRAGLLTQLLRVICNGSVTAMDEDRRVVQAAERAPLPGNF